MHEESEVAAQRANANAKRQAWARDKHLLALEYEGHGWNIGFDSGFELGRQLPGERVGQSHEGGHREGVVEVYDHQGKYLGCMGERFFAALLADHPGDNDMVDEVASRLGSSTSQVGTLLLTCPKCGTENAPNYYDPYVKRLTFRCVTCRAEWTETPLDARTDPAHD